MSLADLGNALSQLPQNPLFQFGIGMLSTPAQRDGRPSWAQVLGNGGMNVQRQAYMQQLAQQQAQQQQAQHAQQDAMQRYISTLPQDQQALAAADPAGYISARAKAVPGSNRPFMVGGKLVSPTGQVIYSGTPAAAPVKYSAMSENLNGIPTYLGSDGKVYQPRNGAMTPIQAAQGGAQSIPSGLPPETQAYVPGVLGRLGGASALNPNGTASQALINAVMQQESGGNPNAVSSKGATGPMQLMPATAASVGVQNIRDPQQNIAGGTAYLNQLLVKYHGNVSQALGAYNAGPGAMDKALAGSGWSKAGKDNFQGGDSTALPGDPTLQGQDYLNSIPVGTRTLAQSYLTGDNPPPSGTALKNDAIRSAWDAALHVDPTLSAGTYATRVSNRKAFTTGKQGQIANRINTALGHLGNYIEQVKDLNEGGLRPINAVSNALGGMTGNTTLGQINTIIPNLASEVAYVYNGGVPAEGEVRERESAFNPSLGSKVNIANAVTTFHLLQSKLAALQSQYEQGAGKFGTPLTMINPDARQAVARLHGMAAQLGIPMGDGATQSAQPSAQSAQTPDINAILQKYGVH